MSRVLVCVRLLVTAGLASLVVFVPVAVAAPGPALLTPAATLAAGLSCTADVHHATMSPVLLLPQTFETASEDYGWNIEPLLLAAGYPVCSVTYPQRGLGDAQVTVAYVVWAIRQIVAWSGRKVSLIGHSQGGFMAAYALKFWPDIARKVDAVVSYDGVFQGGLPLAPAVCAVGCPAVFEQAEPGSATMRAFASVPLPPGPSYTGYWTRTDELLPQSAATIDAPGAANYVLQDMCPGDIAVEHATVDIEVPLAQLTLDALSHPGPARLARVAAADGGQITCGEIPGALSKAPAAIVNAPLGIVMSAAGTLATAPPPLRCYVNAACVKPPLAPTISAKTASSRAAGRSVSLTTTGSLELPPGDTQQCAGTVTVVIGTVRRTLSRETVSVTSSSSPVGPDCLFSARAALPAAAVGRVRVQADYSGSAPPDPLATRLLATRTRSQLPARLLTARATNPTAKET